MEVKSKDAFRIRGKEFPLIAPTNDQFPFFNSGTNKWEYLNLSSIGTKAINDAGSGSTDIWSASKTQTQINSAVVGLLDDRGNFTPSGNYPSTGGSGTAGAILKGDIWQISGLGAGVSALMGTRVVFDGDWVRALGDTPGQTDANWSKSVASSSNLGNANLVSADNARTFTLKSGGTASQNFQILNSGGGNLLKLSGNSTIDFGSSANYINSNFYCNPATNTNFNVLRGTDVYIQSDVAAYITYFRGSSWSKHIALAHDDGQIYAVGASAGFVTNNLVLRNDNAVNSFFSMHAAGTQTLRFDSPNNNFLMKDTRIGGVYTDSFLSKFGVKGNGSTSATTTALFQNSSSVTSLELKDDLSVNIGTSGTGSTTNFYLPTGNSGFNIYSLTGSRILYVSSNGRYLSMSTPNGSSPIQMSVGSDVSPFMRMVNDGFQLIYKPTSGAYEAMNLSMNGGVPYLSMRDAADPSTVYIAGGGGHYFLDSIAIGKAASATAGVMLEVVGIVNAPQIINTPATITVAANAGTVTRANRINNFTNSSAAAMTITMSTTAALDGDMVQVRIYDFSAAAQTISWVNTENSTITVPTTSNGSTTLPLTVGFQYNSATSKWRCIGSV